MVCREMTLCGHKDQGPTHRATPQFRAAPQGSPGPWRAPPEPRSETQTWAPGIPNRGSPQEPKALLEFIWQTTALPPAHLPGPLPSLKRNWGECRHPVPWRSPWPSPSSESPRRWRPPPAEGVWGLCPRQSASQPEPGRRGQRCLRQQDPPLGPRSQSELWDCVDPPSTTPGSGQAPRDLLWEQVDPWLKAGPRAEGRPPLCYGDDPVCPLSRRLPCWTRCPLGLHNSSDINPSSLPSTSSSSEPPRTFHS